MNLKIEVEREEDGRWIAEVTALPGIFELREASGPTPSSYSGATSQPFQSA